MSNIIVNLLEAYSVVIVFVFVIVITIHCINWYLLLFLDLFSLG